MATRSSPYQKACLPCPVSSPGSTASDPVTLVFPKIFSSAFSSSGYPAELFPSAGSKPLTSSLELEVSGSFFQLVLPACENFKSSLFLELLLLAISSPPGGEASPSRGTPHSREVDSPRPPPLEAVNFRSLTLSSIRDEARPTAPSLGRLTPPLPRTSKLPIDSSPQQLCPPIQPS